MITHLDRLPSENHEILRAHRHEPCELFTQDALNLIRLLDRNGYADRVDRGFDEDAFGFVPGDDERVEEDFDGCAAGTISERKRERMEGLPCFDFRYVVSLDDFGRKVLERESGRQSAPDGIQVGT